MALPSIWRPTDLWPSEFRWNQATPQWITSHHVTSCASILTTGDSCSLRQSYIKLQLSALNAVAITIAAHTQFEAQSVLGLRALYTHGVVIEINRRPL